MKDWVFCNKCSLKFQPNITFSLSECGHIFCEKCMEKIDHFKKCVLCNKPTAVIEISKNMDSNAQMFFWPLENVLQQSLKIFNFQNIHKNLFLQTLNRKYNYAKKECITYYNANKKLRKENQLMRQMLKNAGYNTIPFLTSTPSNTSEPLYDKNLSMLSSIRFTPGSVPGSAQRISYPDKSVGQPMAPCEISSTHGPSPAQTVPRGYPAPIHKEFMPNPASATPKFMECRLRKFGYPAGYPRK